MFMKKNLIKVVLLLSFFFLNPAKGQDGMGADFTQLLSGESFTEQFPDWTVNHPDLHEELVEVNGQTALRLSGPDGIIRTITNDGGPLKGKVSLLIDFSIGEGSFGVYGFEESVRRSEKRGTVGFFLRPVDQVIFPSGSGKTTLTLDLVPGKWYRFLLDFEFPEDPLQFPLGVATVWELTTRGTTRIVDQFSFVTGWPEGERPTALSGMGFGLYSTPSNEDIQEMFVYRAFLIPSEDLPESLRNGELNPLQAQADPETSDTPASVKQASVTVTAEMRAHAQNNVENYKWAQQRRDNLERRLKNYLSASDEFLWNMIPSQSIRRSHQANIMYVPSVSGVERFWNPSEVIPADVGPPGSGEKFFSVPHQASGGWGTKFRYHIDPFVEPWKIQCRGSGQWYPTNDFASFYLSALDENGDFDPSRGDPAFLKSKGPTGTEDWVDDGTGAVIGEHEFLFIAHYAFRIWQQCIDVVRDLSELYTLTGDPLPAHKAGVLLARMASLYPDIIYRTRPYSDELPVGGGAMDSIWETWTTERVSLAYDRIFDALIENQELAAFTSLQLGEPNLSGRQVAGLIENGLLREFLRRIKSKDIFGNVGMHQTAMAAAAIALDNGEETRINLDWLFEPEGGRMPEALLVQLSRDGYGTEAGMGYASLPIHSFFRVAELLASYPQYFRGDLFAEFPKFANSLSASEISRVHVSATLPLADGGRALQMLDWGLPLPAEIALAGFNRFGRPENAKALYYSTLGNPVRLPRDIYAADPEQALVEAIEAIEMINEEQGKRPRPSFNSGGLGLAVLQTTDPDKNPRTIAMNYGPMSWGHGHSDRLGLHLISNGRYMATDLGYPTFTGANAERIAWSSHTVSHNTVMVDEQPMRMWSAFSGKTRLFADAGTVRVVDVDGGGERTLRGKGHSGPATHPFADDDPKRIYPQVDTYRRSLVMVDIDEENSYYLDVFWVRGGRTHRLIQNGGAPTATSNWENWTLQEGGTLAGEDVPFGHMDETITWKYNGSGFQFLKDVERAQPDQNFWVEWEIIDPLTGKAGSDAPHFRVHNLTPIDEAVLASGVTPRGGPGDLRYLHRIRNGSLAAPLSSQFVSILEPYGACPNIESIRLLELEPDQNGFGVAVEVTLIDGRKDRIFLNPEPEDVIGNPTLGQLTGRFAWVRSAVDGSLLEGRLIEASSFIFDGSEWAHDSQPSGYAGEIASINMEDSRHVILDTGLGNLPDSLVGRYLVVDNHQRADASYRIEAVLPNGRVDLGPAALEELHVDSSDYSKGRITNIQAGESFRIAYPVSL